MTETQVETERIAALLAEATPEAAGQLGELAETTSDKEVRKAARRALYQLGQRGIKPAPRDVATEPEIGRVSSDTLRAYASAYDGAGNRLLLLVLPDPDGGSPILTYTLINDEIGVREFESRRMSRKETSAYIERFEQQLEKGLALAEIEGDYARWLVAQGRLINQRRGTRTPRGLLDLLPRIGEPRSAPDSAPIYAQFDAEEIKADASLPHDPEDLFRLPWFEPWFFAAEEALPWLEAWQKVESGVIVVSDSVQQERRQAIVTEAVRGLFTPETEIRYIKRLEETADILRRRGKTAEARQALYHALSLIAERDVSQTPFARTLAQRTIEAAIEMVRARKNDEVMR
jgi:hypothetical protein